MVPSKTIGVDYDKDKMSMKVLNWIEGKEKILNIVSVPYNSSLIFLEVILKLMGENKKLLYITDEKEENVDIIDCLKRFTSFREYTYVRKNSSDIARANLYVTNYDMALKLKKDYDLVIYDDTSYFPRYSKYEILELMAAFYKEGKKIICRSVEPIFKNARVLDIPAKDCKTPLAEPRIITTRIDISKDIPYVVYEYLKWSLRSERKVIIYVPDKDKAENVYNCLSNLKEGLHNNIMYFKDKNDMKYFQNFMANRRGIIIMECQSEFDMELRDTDIMVYFADDKIFDYKKLLYFCGKVGRYPGLCNGEVIFLAKEISKDMEIAKDMARGFNKQAWELGLLSI